MKRKILSLLMALTLMLGLLPAAAFQARAEGGSEVRVTIDSVTTEYATLEEALTQAYYKTVTIDLLTDVTVEEPIALWTYENILLRGNGYSITCTSSDQAISVQKANLILDNVHIRNSSGSTTEVVGISTAGTLTIQNDASVVSDTAKAIVNTGTLIITDGTVETHSEKSSSYAIYSENATTKLEAPAGSEINIISSSDVAAVYAASGSVTIAGNLHTGLIRTSKAYKNEQVSVIKLSGALTGEPVPVYYNQFVQLDHVDFAMIGPAEGYTITEDDAAMIDTRDIEFTPYLGEDGWIWAKYAHVHHTSPGQYQSLDNGKHSFYCSCGEQVEEDCRYEQKNDHEIHWLECSDCGYIDPESQAQHTLQDCLCECGYSGHQADQWTADSDLITHTGTCIDCGKDLREDHAGIWGRDDESHWWFCAKNCGYREASEPHGWSDWICKDGHNIHYRQCYCGAVVEEPHTDSDNDLVCEECGGNLCYDTDDDHRCDECDLLLKELCVDADGNHRCDAELCGARVEAWCVDTDNNHRCDAPACRAYLKELCVDDDNDLLCDICRIDLCDHWVPDFAPNEDNTHTGICQYCDRSITGNCDFSEGQAWDDSNHWDYCICGRLSNEAPHTYAEVISRTLVGHIQKCEDCESKNSEAHQFVDGVCEVCQAEQLELYDVYVGGIGLKNGDYLDEAGNKTTTKPEGGYAHYKDGVLTLHNYHYDGDGFLWKEEPDVDAGNDIPYTASIYATTDLILELSGDNSLTNLSDEADAQQDGIACEQDLTICGQGALTVLANNDGIHMQGGDLTMKEGVLYLGTQGEDENGDWFNNEIGDDGIATEYGDVIIEDGDLFINSDDHGMDVNGNVIIRGGCMEVIADDDGLNVEKDIIILDGDVYVEAVDYGLDSDEGSVTIAGGCVDIYAEEWSGIDAKKHVDICGGELYISAYDAGIAAEHVTISGGYMEIAGDWVDIYGEKITLHVELPEGAYLDDYGYEMFLDGGDDGLVIDGSTEEDALTPTAFYYNGKILLENLHEDLSLTVIVVGYTDGQMMHLQMAENVTGDVEISEEVLACEEMKAFFLDDGFVPVCASLLIV